MTMAANSQSTGAPWSGPRNGRPWAMAVADRGAARRSALRLDLDVVGRLPSSPGHPSRPQAPSGPRLERRCAHRHRLGPPAIVSSAAQPFGHRPEPRHHRCRSYRRRRSQTRPTVQDQRSREQRRQAIGRRRPEAASRSRSRPGSETCRPAPRRTPRRRRRSVIASSTDLHSRTSSLSSASDGFATCRERPPHPDTSRGRTRSGRAARTPAGGAGAGPATRARARSCFASRRSAATRSGDGGEPSSSPASPDRVATLREHEIDDRPIDALQPQLLADRPLPARPARSRDSTHARANTSSSSMPNSISLAMAPSTRSGRYPAPPSRRRTSPTDRDRASRNRPAASSTTCGSSTAARSSRRSAYVRDARGDRACTRSERLRDHQEKSTA